MALNQGNQQYPAGFQQHHDESHKSSKSDYHEVTDISDNPAPAGYGGTQQGALPTSQHAALPSTHTTQQAALPSTQRAALPPAQTNQTNYSAAPGVTQHSGVPATQTSYGSSGVPATQTSYGSSGVPATQTSYGSSGVPASQTSYGNSPAVGTANTTGAGIANPITSTPGTHSSGSGLGHHHLGSSVTPHSTTAPVAATHGSSVHGAVPGSSSAATGGSVHNSNVPSQGYANQVTPNTHTAGGLGTHTHAGTHPTSATAAPVQEVSRLNISPTPGTGVNTTSPHRYNDNGNTVSATPGIHATGPGTHHVAGPGTHHATGATLPSTGVQSNAPVHASSNGSHVPGSIVGGGVAPGHQTGVPASSTTPGAVTTTTNANASTNAAAQNADAALNRALNASGNGARVGQPSVHSSSVGQPSFHSTGVNPVPAEQSAVAAAATANQALGSVLGGKPHAAVGNPISVQTTTTTPAGVHSALRSEVQPTITHTNTGSGAPATVQSASSGLSTHSHTVQPAAHNSAHPSAYNTTAGVAPGQHTSANLPVQNF